MRPIVRGLCGFPMPKSLKCFGVRAVILGMRYRIPGAAAVAVAAICGSKVFGFAEFDSGELYLLTTASATYDSRVDGTQTDQGDLILRLDPTLDYTRTNSEINMTANAGIDFDRYVYNPKYDTHDISSGFTLTLPPNTGPAYSGAFSASYTQAFAVSSDVDQLVHTDSFSTSLNLRIPTGLKTTFLVGGGYSDLDRGAFGSSKSWQGSLGFLYADFLEGTNLQVQYMRTGASTSGGTISASAAAAEAVPAGAVAGELDQSSNSFTASLVRKIYYDLTGSLAYGYTFLGRAADETTSRQTQDDSSTFSASLTGPFLPKSKFPKLDSSLTISYQRALTPGINDTAGATVVGSASVSWDIREPTRLALAVSRSQQLTVTNLSAVNTGVTATVTEKVGHFINLNGNVGYQNTEYHGTSRTDNAYNAGLGLIYAVPERPWTFSATYAYTETQSDAASADYSHHVVIISAVYKY